MTTDQKTIDEWKRDFDRRLDAFMQKRAAAIGNPGQWKLYHFKVTDVCFSQNAKGMISFRVSPPPEGLSPQEQLSLRQYVNDTCAQKGFAPNKPRITPLSSKMIDRVRTGDPEAWNIFTRKHRGSFQEHAAALLGNGKNPTILDPDDLVQCALTETLIMFRKDGIKPEVRPQNLINLNLARENEKRLTPKLRRQSDSGRIDTMDIRKVEYEGVLEALEQQLLKVLEETKRNLLARINHGPKSGSRTPKHQVALLDIIIERWWNKDTPLILEELGNKLGLTKERARQIMDGLTQEIQQTAHLLAEENPEYEPIAGVVGHLVRSSKSSHRR